MWRFDDREILVVDWSYFMKKLFRFALPAIVLSIAFATTANAQINEILKRVDAHYQALTSLRADIKREQFNTQLGETDTYSGTVLMLPNKKNSKDASFRLDWTKPEAESMSVIGGKFVAYKPSANTAWKGSSSSKKVKSGGGNVLTIMSMSKKDIKDNYDVAYIGQETVGGSVGAWHLKLTPKAKADFKVADVWIDSDGMPIQVKVTLPNNDTDTVFLSGIKKNQTIDLAEFRITVPPGVKVVNA